MLNNATGFKHIYIATGYTDLRKSIDGLAMLISTEFNLNPYDTGSIFLFCGKRNDRIKALVFEGDGFLLLYKRLANGKYKWPRSGEEGKPFVSRTPKMPGKKECRQRCLEWIENGMYNDGNLPVSKAFERFLKDYKDRYGETEQFFKLKSLS